MATILLAWELGSGLGHLMNLRPIGESLAARGHRVVAAVRNPQDARRCFSGSDIFCMPAPVLPDDYRPPFAVVRSFTHLLWNMGFHESSLIEAPFTAWNRIFDDVQPDLVVADHSPTALLASWGRRNRPIRRVNVGLGFFCPPEGFPLPSWSVGGQSIPFTQHIENERQLTRKINELLRAHDRFPLEQLSHLFTRIEDVILATYAEFDHFNGRSGVRYWGHWPFGVEKTPVWPDARGPHLFAYLKPFPALESLLGLLRQCQCPTLAVVPGIDNTLINRWSGPTLRIVGQPVDLQRVGAICDMAIHHASHGVMASLLLAGKPCLALPLFVEQLLLSQKMACHGFGLAAPASGHQYIKTALQRLLTDSSYMEHAQAFAARYAGWSPGEQITELVDHLEQILQRPPREAIDRSPYC